METRAKKSKRLKCVTKNCTNYEIQGEGLCEKCTIKRYSDIFYHPSLVSVGEQYEEV